MLRLTQTLALTATSLLTVAASAQCFTVQQPSPNLDRWMYAFGSTPGLETSATVFGAISTPGFDDRDAQFLLGWNTDGVVPTGAPAERYMVRSARVTVWVSNDLRFVYDDTPDSVVSLYDAADPEYVPDADPGRPTEVFGAGYRNGQSAATFTETSPYSPFPPFPPQDGVRSVFPAIFDANGVATDVSRQVRQRFEAMPMGLGLCEGVVPGTRVPAGAAMTFDLNVADPIVQRYLASGLQDGRVRLVVTSLSPATGGPGGGSGEYPAFYTKENPTAGLLGYTPRLDLEVALVPDIDVDQNGVADQDDVAYLVNVIAGGENPTEIDPDLTGDGIADQNDVALLVNLVAGGDVCG